MPASNASTECAGAVPGQDVDRRVELYVRDQYPAALAETVRTVLERCTRLEASSVIDDYWLEQWPSCVPSVDADLLDGQLSRRERLAAFEEWAAQHDYTLEPAFQTQAVTTSMLDRDVRYENTSVPLLALALYENGELAGVAPCSDGDQTHTVEDALTALETESFDSFPEPPAPQSDPSTAAEVNQE